MPVALDEPVPVWLLVPVKLLEGVPVALDEPEPVWLLVTVELLEGVPVALDEPVPVWLPVPVALLEGVPVWLPESLDDLLGLPEPVFESEADIEADGVVEAVHEASCSRCRTSTLQADCADSCCPMRPLQTTWYASSSSSTVSPTSLLS